MSLFLVRRCVPVDRNRSVSGAGRRAVPALIGLLILLLMTAAAGAAVVQETAVDSNGTLLVRSTTPTDGSPLEVTPTDGSPAPVGTRGGNTYRWLDTNHLNGVVADAAISGDGAYGAAGWWLNSKRVALHEILGDNVAEWTWPMTAAFEISVDVDQFGDKITSTGRGDLLYVHDAAGSTPIFSHPYTPPIVGYHCAVSDPGNTYAGAGGNPAGGAGDVSVYDGSGALRFVRTLPNPPEGVCVSADGLVVAANVRQFVKIWDAMTGALRDSIPILGDTQAPAVISGDGIGLVTGGFSRVVRYYEWNGTEYLPVWTYSIPATTWITSVAISDDGSTIAAGTWTNPTGGKVVLFDRTSSTPLWTDASYGDYVPALSFTPDGGFLAAASWGGVNGTIGNVVSVYARSSQAPVHTIADDAIVGVGSCMAVDINDDGTEVLAGGKAVHAREFGNGGWLMSINVGDLTHAAGDGQPAGAAAPSTLAIYPNPFNPETKLSFRIARAGFVRLGIFDCAGSRVRTLFEGWGTAGERATTWDGRDDAGRPLASGVYLAQLETQESSLRRKLVLLK